MRIFNAHEMWHNDVGTKDTNATTPIFNEPAKASYQC